MAKRKTDKDVKELLDRVEAQGWRIEYRDACVLCYSPDGKTIVNVDYTPSARHWQKRAFRHLKAGGFDPEA